MEKNEKISMLEDLLELSSGALSEDTVLSTVTEYDSMAKLSLIVLFDDEFEVAGLLGLDGLLELDDWLELDD